MSQFFISKLNSSTTPLSASQEFVGPADVLTGWQEVDINLAGSPPSADGMLTFEFSPDGVHWDVSIPLTVANPNVVPITLRAVLPYFRVKYVNGSTPQSAFRLTTMFHRGSAMRLTRFNNQTLDSNEPVQIVRVSSSSLPSGAATNATLTSILNAVNSTLTVTGSVGLNPSPVITANTATTGTSGLMVGAPPYNPVWITGSVGLNPVPTITANTATTGSAGLAVGNAPYQPLWITATSSLPVTISSQVGVNNFPLVQSTSGSASVYTHGPQAITGSVVVFTQGAQLVSGTVNVIVSGTTGLHVAAPATSPVWVTGSVGLNPVPTITANTSTTGSAGLMVGNAPYQPIWVSITSSLPVTFGSLPQLSINNFPLTQNISGSVSIFTQGPQAVTGSVSTYTQGPQQVTGTVSVFTQGPQLVSGTVLVTGSVNVYTQGAQFVSGTVGINNFPATQNVTGSVSIYTQGPQLISGTVTSVGSANVYTQGPQAITGSVSTYTQGAQLISGSVGLTNWPTIHGVTGSISVYTQGPQFVSGTVSLGNWPTVIAVSGSQLTGSTFSGFPTIVGGVFSSSLGALVKALSTDAGGALYVIPTGSVSIYTQGAQLVTGTVSIYTQGPQAVSGSLSVYTQGAQLVSGSINVTVSGSTGLHIAAPITSPVWITGSVGLNPAITANTATTGSAGLMVGNAPYQPVWVSITSSLPVTFGSLPQLSINNFPATQNVSGSVSIFTQGPQAVTGSVSIYTQGAQLVSGSVTSIGSANVYTSGPQLVTGSVSVFTQGAQLISGTVTSVGSSNVYTSGPQAVTGSISVFTQGAQLVSGTVTVTSTGSLSVTGSVSVVGYAVSGSQASGAPVQIAGVDGTKIVRTLLTDATGQLWITGSVLAVNSSASPVNVTGSIGIMTQVTVTTTGSLPTIEVVSQAGSSTSVAGSASSVTLLAANSARKGATVYNESTVVLYLKLGAVASVTSYTVQMAASSYYEVPFKYAGIIDGIWASATGNARVTELT